ncbi:Scr1 family TA system antitoxin-like transcriptional regulator [Streptomyces sp. NPDC002746]
MSEHPHPVVLVVGANLRDARERRYILLEQAAELLDVTPETFCAIEAGRRAIAPADIHRLCALYGSHDGQALARMTAVACSGPVRTGQAWPAEPDRSSAVPFRDDFEGHGRRLNAVVRQAGRVRWLSTVLVPPPLQTPEYSDILKQPPAALPGAPLPHAPHQTFVLEESVLIGGDHVPAVMEGQVAHLADLRVPGATIHIVHGLFESGSIAELTMTAGTVLVKGWEPPTYQAGTALSLHLDAAVAAATSAGSGRLIDRALAQHRERFAATAPEGS